MDFLKKTYLKQGQTSFDGQVGILSYYMRDNSVMAN